MRDGAGARLGIGVYKHSYKDLQVSEKSPCRRWIQYVFPVLHLKQWLEMLVFTLRIQKSVPVVGNVSY